jgi:hypothetical protein
MSDETNGVQEPQDRDTEQQGFTTYGYEVEKAYERFLDGEAGAQEEFVQLFKRKHAETRRRLGLE